jgi:putative ABC transport system ATP-binding protein
MSTSAIAISQVSKSFKTAKQAVPVLKEIDLTVDQGDFLIIFGPSGCGKSTLLHVVLGLEPPNQGQVKLLGHKLFNIHQEQRQVVVDEDRVADFRKQHVGMVYQQTYWVKSLNVLNNVAFPLWLLGQDKQLALDRAKEVLETVGMLDWSDYIPTELSSGQQQRVNLARALISNPEILIADEPTGNLDYEAGVELMKMLLKLNQAGKTVVMVTHDLEYLPYADKAAEMLDGRIKGVYHGQEKKAILKNLKTKKMELVS